MPQFVFFFLGQSKTLIIVGLAEKTNAETLKNAFEGAVSARVAVDKDTGVSKRCVECLLFHVFFFTQFKGLLHNILFIFLRFGFVDFESEEHCKAVKEAMEDCEIDGSKVTLDFSKNKIKQGQQGANGGLEARPAGSGTGRRRRRGRGAKGSRGGNGCFA